MLRLDDGRVNVKVTSTDRLGAIGAVVGPCLDQVCVELDIFLDPEDPRAARQPPELPRGHACGKSPEDAEGILLLAVDQPRPSEIISKVIRAHVEANAVITSPRFEGHGGHPLIFSASLRAELAAISEERQGIREVFQAHRNDILEVPIVDPVVRLDLNTPEEYERAKRLYERP